MKYLAYGTFPQSGGNMFLEPGFLTAEHDASITNWSAYSFHPMNIVEHVRYSYYDAGAFNQYDQRNPSVGVTKPYYGKTGAYSFLKAPRYTAGGSQHAAEVGPLARVLVNYATGISPWVDTVNNFMSGTIAPSVGLNLGAATSQIPALRSVLGRHAARVIECKLVADEMSTWITQLTATTGTGQTYRHRNIPRETSTGCGLTEAPRGALGHWIRLDGRKISNYQCVVPSTWNLGPKDRNDVKGPVEQAIEGTVVTDSETGRTRVGRIVRSFDPCIACAVHLVSPDKKKVTKFKVADPNS
jgi:hydrogenase large subunit